MLLNHRLRRLEDQIKVCDDQRRREETRAIARILLADANARMAARAYSHALTEYGSRDPRTQELAHRAQEIKRAVLERHQGRSQHAA
jgi:hypothetical protein